jgi:hypothetical protein
MDDFIVPLMDERLAGIPARFWQKFLEIFAEGISGPEVEKKLASLREAAEKSGLTATDPNAFDKIEEGLRGLFEKL